MAIIVLILVFTVGKAAGVFKSFGGITTQDEEDKSGKVTVPDVRGMSEENAKALLNKKRTRNSGCDKKKSLRSIRQERSQNRHRKPEKRYQNIPRLK